MHFILSQQLLIGYIYFLINIIFSSDACFHIPKPKSSIPIMMASSTIPNASLTFNCQTYVDLKSPPTNISYLSSSPLSAPNHRLPRLFTVRASDSEFEAAVVAGKFPEAPPVPPTPAVPVGTPVVPSLVSVFN